MGKGWNYYDYHYCCVCEYRRTTITIIIIAGVAAAMVSLS
jgi:hypothetical protein